MKKYLCEFLGTCILVLFGCGVAVFTNASLIATSLAFGLTIIAIGYALGSVSGAHVNPAVTFAMWIDRKISTKDFILYIIAQVLGALAGSGLLILVLKSTNFGDWQYVGLGANAFGDEAQSGITMLGALVTEIILTFVFVLSVIGVTRDEKKSAVAPVVIGLSLTLVHLLGIKLTGTSVNPARSLAPAIFLGGAQLEQVWVFVVGPLIGGALASLIYFFIHMNEELEQISVKKISFIEEETKAARKEEIQKRVITDKKNQKPKTNTKKATTKAKTTKTRGTAKN